MREAGAWLRRRAENVAAAMIAVMFAAFVVKESEEIRFDLLSESAGRRARIVMGIVASAALVILYGASLPASYKYVTFMQVEKSSYLKVRMDWLFSIYLIFLVAILVRYLWILSQLLRGREPEQGDPTKSSSAL